MNLVELFNCSNEFFPIHEPEKMSSLKRTMCFNKFFRVRVQRKAEIARSFFNDAERARPRTSQTK
jgi:hypothetical protein